MGCDVHIVVEKRHGDKWVGVWASDFRPSAPDMDGLEDHDDFPRILWRNYRTFAALAGVRGDGPEPRGLPADMSDLARMCEIDHSSTWYTLAEAVAIFSSTRNEKYPEFFPDDFSLSAEYELDSYRVLFWFDN